MSNTTTDISAEPADLEDLKHVEQRARLLARLEGTDPDETTEQAHPLLANVKVTHYAWHVFARKLLNAARLLTTLKLTEEQAAGASAAAAKGSGTLQ